MYSKRAFKSAFKLCWPEWILVSLGLVSGGILRFSHHIHYSEWSHPFPDLVRIVLVVLRDVTAQSLYVTGPFVVVALSFSEHGSIGADITW